jgi:hypothetical protein
LPIILTNVFSCNFASSRTRSPSTNISIHNVVSSRQYWHHIVYQQTFLFIMLYLQDNIVHHIVY